VKAFFIFKVLLFQVFLS